MIERPDVFFTPSGVRLRCRVRRSGALDWLLVPGGPGLGSESLHALADTIDAPGSVWMVDLPGDGSNVDAPGAPEDPFSMWPEVIAEAADAFDRPVLVGHSTGGMYLLSTPALEARLAGLVLISSAPDASWRASFVEMLRAHPLPEVDTANARFEAERTNARLGEIVVASAPWSFGPASVGRGRTMLSNLPYNVAAMDWSDRHFDATYAARWIPQTLPTSIVSGEDDRVIPPSVWDRAEWDRPNVVRRVVPRAGHFPWIDDPDALRDAFREVVASTRSS